MRHLTDGQRNELEDELRHQLQRLERSMKLTDEAAQPVELDQTAVGRLSRMDSLQNQGITKNLRERERVRHSRLSEAIRRMEAGTYGLCAQCGEEVPFGRLLVFPEARSCAGCGGDG